MNTQEKIKNPRKLFEAAFCIIYLIFIFTATIIFFLNSYKGTSVFLFGLLSFILGLGDSFHLVPRILIAFKGETKKLQWFSGLGLMISSITMTIFYLILFYIFRIIFPEIRVVPLTEILLWISALLRIVLCLFPQNNWFNPKGNIKWSVYRNLPFLITGFCDFYLFFQVGSSNYSYLWWMAPAILVSFVCYLPVVLFSKKYPVVGMLMIPKTVAYMIMVSLGLYFTFHI